MMALYKIELYRLIRGPMYNVKMKGEGNCSYYRTSQMTALVVRYSTKGLSLRVEKVAVSILDEGFGIG